MSADKVNWAHYAAAYDLMARHNPAYQELIQHCVSTVAGWTLQAGDTLADIGGGTGNFSLALARALPSVSMLHVDSDEAMVRVARAKAQDAAVTNWRSVRVNLEEDEWNLPALAGIVTVHSLYVLKNPQGAIEKLCARLRPGGYIYACDFGRVMNVSDWGRYLVTTSIRTRGVWKTTKLFFQLGEVRRQNKRIAACQRAGVYWTHELGEFTQCFERQGLKVLAAKNCLYRGYDDLVIGQKPQDADATATRLH
jgi:ubiquinone/menaquinone biosynthesis C-methylase UbiE